MRGGKQTERGRGRKQSAAGGRLRLRRKRVVSAEQLEARELLAGDLVAHWLADESVSATEDGVVTEWSDQIGNRSARGIGTPQRVSGELGGRASIRFEAADGADGLQVRSVDNPLAGAGDFSVAVTFVTDSDQLVGTDGQWFQNTGLVDANALGLSEDWGISLNAAGQISTGMGDGFAQPQRTMYSSASGVNDGALHTVVVTRQGAQMAIYLDDSPPDVQDGFSADPRSSLNMTFGILQTNAGPFTGQLAQVRIYNGALSGSEVASLVDEVSTYYSNSAPVAQDNAYSLDEDPTLFFVPGTQGVLSNDSDPDGDDLTAVLVTEPAHGSLVLNPDGSFLYQPATHYFGSDSFQYAAQDFRPGNVATVTLEIRPVYDPPVPVADQYQTTPTAVLQIPALIGVLQNDVNVDNSPLTAVLDQDVAPGEGTLVLNPDGSFEYTAGGFAGETSFRYRVNDGRRDTAPVTVTLVVNTAPAPQDDLYQANEDETLTVPLAEGILSNDLDAEGNSLSWNLLTNPTHGTLQLEPDGSFQYIPEPDFSGEDEFTYNVTDGIDTSAAATVRIVVGPVNDPPEITGDAYLVEGSQLEVSAEQGLLANDRDRDSTSLTALLVDAPQSGTLSLAADGSFRYEPAPGFFGQDRFRYQLSDGAATSSPADVILVTQLPQTGINTPSGDSIVTFNEVMYNPTGTQARGEWIELHNQMAINMDISRWSLTGGIFYEFPEGTIIPGNGYLVIASNPAALAEDSGVAVRSAPSVVG